MTKKNPRTSPACVPAEAPSPLQGGRAAGEPLKEWVVEYVPHGREVECDYYTDLGACHHGYYSRLAVTRVR